MTRLLLILAALLIPLSARAASDQYFNDWQVRHAATPTDLSTMQAVHPGYIASLDNVSGNPQTFVAWPLNTFSCSVPHCYNAPGVQWVDLYTIAASYITWASLPGKPTTFTPANHELTHLLNGSDAIAGLSPSQIAACAANQVILGNGSANACGQLQFSQLGGIPTLSATAPVLLNGGMYGPLGSPVNISVANSTTGSTGVIQLANDLGGTATSPKVLQVNGVSYPAGGSIPMFAVPIANGSSSVVYALIANPAISSGANIDVTKLAHGTNGQVLATIAGANAFVDLSSIGIVTIGGDLGGAANAPTVVAVTGSGGTLPVNATTVQFVAGVTGATVKQDATSGAPHDMTIEAQSSSTNSYSPAFLIFNAGYNTGGGIGAVQFGYAGHPGAFGTLGSTGANFQNGLTASEGSISHNASSPSETHVIGRNAGFAMAEDTLWFRGTSTSTANINFDITAWLGSAGIPDNHTYFATYEIYSAGLPNATTTAAATWTKASGTLTAQQGVPGINSGALTMGASNPTNNTMRFAVTPPTSTTTVWTAKVHVVQL